MELYEVGIEYEGMTAIFSTKEKAEAYVAKRDAEDLANELKYGSIKSADKYRSQYYIATVAVDAEEV